MDLLIIWYASLYQSALSSIVANNHAYRYGAEVSIARSGKSSQSRCRLDHGYLEKHQAARHAALPLGIEENFLLGFSKLRTYLLRTPISISDVTRILQAIENGDARAANDLLPLVYQELRRLAAH